ncbi:MAG: energy-coupling factor transporter transmembrane component T [Erysipelotrichaceae bacterium]|nr:energy-coupling factor transporter transmembrane component T [Erysipelotrichaceae bacterium]
MEHIFTTNFLAIGRKKVFCKGRKKNIKQYQLSDKINPLTIVGLILLFSVILTVGEQLQYLVSLIFVLGLLLLFSPKKAFKTICSLSVVWGIVHLLKPYLGNVLIGSIYTMLLIVLKFSPLFILGKVLSSYSSSHLMAAFRKVGIDGGIGIGVTVFFRFIPEISIRMKEINNGMKIRGFRASIFKPLKTFELYFVPLMYKCIDISDTLTCSIISKGIEYDGKKTSFHEVKITVIDIAMLMGGIALLGVSVWKIF